MKHFSPDASLPAHFAHGLVFTALQLVHVFLNSRWHSLTQNTYTYLNKVGKDRDDLSCNKYLNQSVVFSFSVRMASTVLWGHWYSVHQRSPLKISFTYQRVRKSIILEYVLDYKTVFLLVVLLKYCCLMCILVSTNSLNFSPSPPPGYGT